MYISEVDWRVDDAVFEIPKYTYQNFIENDETRTFEKKHRKHTSKGHKDIKHKHKGQRGQQDKGHKDIQHTDNKPEYTYQNFIEQ